MIDMSKKKQLELNSRTRVVVINGNNESPLIKVVIIDYTGSILLSSGHAFLFFISFSMSQL